MLVRSYLERSSILRHLGALGLMALAIGGCHLPVGESDGATSASSPVSAAPVEPPAPEKKPFAPSRAGCESVPVFTDGAANGRVCVEDAGKNGLTVVDLSDAWTPRVFAIDPETRSAPEYRAKYLELANQASADLGLYGIAPSVSVLAARLVDEKRTTCDAAVDLAAIEALREARKAAPDARAAARLAQGPDARPALTAIQAELACAGLLKKSAVSGAPSGAMEAALEAFRRRHMIVGAGLDDDTLGALALGGDELALRALLRTLREHVAEAAGLVEDGSATGSHALVADREIDLSPFAPPNEQTLDDGTPDFVGAAADGAARALGWTSPAAARAFLAAQGPAGTRGLRVAVALPTPPAYHAKAMELRVEIDRGDVIVDRAAKRPPGEARSPSFVLYAKDGDRERPLIRWSTTIGGWKKERAEDGEVSLKFKESDVGERVWKQILAAPAWLPPDSTPETDLVNESQDGTIALKRDLIQPGYRNAYGLVMLIHHEVVERRGEARFVDHGIRTHGSVDYRSIRRGTSHGCHRLYNQLALRLSGYLLDHRAHARRGQVNVGYKRAIEWNGETVQIDVPTRGYLYELDPPVPVRVLRGRVAGELPKPVSSAAPVGDGKKQG